jgi:hypothetical protein
VRSGDLRGPREHACRGVRRGEAPRIKEDLQFALDAFAAVGREIGLI